MHARTARLARTVLIATVAVLTVITSAAGQDTGEDTAMAIESRADRYAAIAREIWELAEVGYQKSAARSCCAGSWRNPASPYASPAISPANKSAKFRFRGISSHAAGSPERGRSALDGVEAMNHMVNLMREHVPQETRINYVITHGGSAPNVVPDFAEVYYYVRHPEVASVVELFDRVVKAAEGGTSIGTKGMLLAAKTLAATATDLFRQPDTIVAAAAELRQRRGAGFVYKALVGAREPPLDYRR